MNININNFVRLRINVFVSTDIHDVNERKYIFYVIFATKCSLLLRFTRAFLLYLPAYTCLRIHLHKYIWFVFKFVPYLPSVQ